MLSFKQVVSYYTDYLAIYLVLILIQLESSRQQETDKASSLQKEIKDASNKVQVCYNIIMHMCYYVLVINTCTYQSGLYSSQIIFLSKGPVSEPA